MTLKYPDRISFNSKKVCFTQNLCALYCIREKMEWWFYLKCIIFLKPKWKLSAPLSPMKRHHHRGERLASWQRSAAVIFFCVPIQVNEMRVQRNRAEIQVWQRNEGHETEEFNEWSWAAVQSHSLLPFSMTANAISCLYPTTHLTRVRMYSKCLIRTCSMLPQDDKCGPLNVCAVWIWMDMFSSGSGLFPRT